MGTDGVDHLYNNVLFKKKKKMRCYGQLDNYPSTRITVQHKNEF